MIAQHFPCQRRRGFSLLEVIVALAIFLIAMIAIGQLITLGTDRALEVQFQARGVLLCQAKMAELVAGAVPLSNPVSDAQFDEDPNWTWSLEADQDGSTSLLWNVKVTVSRQRPDGSKIQSSLSQKVLDPAQRGSATDAAVVAAANASNSTANSNNNNGSTNSQTPSSTAGGGMAGAAGSRGTTSSTPSSSSLIQPSSGSRGSTSSTSTSGGSTSSGTGASKTTGTSKTGTSGTGGK